MATNKYITLTNSNDSVSKKFRVLMSGLTRNVQKAMNVDFDLEGIPDVSFGSIREQYALTIKVRHEEPESDYGSRADLEYFYRLNAPNGAVTPVITLVTHTGETKSVLFTGSFEEAALGVMLEGQTAWFHVKVMLLIKPA